MNQFIIIFTSTEFKRQLSLLVGSDRKRFCADFDHVFSTKIKSVTNTSCWFSSSWNWIKSEKSNEYWRGAFNCVHDSCTAELEPYILRQGLSVDTFVSIFVKVKHSGTKHEDIRLTQRIFGEERGQIAKLIIADGLLNTLATHTIFNNEHPNENPKPTNKDQLKMIKSDYVHKERLSSFLYGDLLGAKEACDNLCQPSTFKNGLTGYIREIKMSPFGFLMLSEIQVKIWTHVQKKNPVWYFDATGSVVVNKLREKKPLLYSLVCHDFENNTNLSIADFVTTDQSELSISSYLFTIKHIMNRYLERSNKLFSLAPIVVTDFSWAMINSVLQIFNNCNKRMYVNWCYDVMINKVVDKKNWLPTRVILCSTHMLKIIIKRVKKLPLNNERSFKNKKQKTGNEQLTDSQDENDYTSSVKKAFIIAFGLLQNATTVADFESILEDVYMMFNSKFSDPKCCSSILKIRERIENRQLETKISAVLSDDTNAVQKNEIDDVLFDEANGSLTRESPFKLYYENMCLLFKSKCVMNNTGDFKPNKFYAPILLDELQKFFYILPLWTGIMISEFEILYPNYKLTSRLPNNSVENHFGRLKNRILDRKAVYPSVLSTRLYRYILMKYYSLYEKLPIDPDIEPSGQEEERWNTKKHGKGEKGYYYSRVANYAYTNDDDEDILKSITPVCREAFDRLFSTEAVGMQIDERDELKDMECMSFESMDRNDISIETDDSVIEIVHDERPASSFSLTEGYLSNGALNLKEVIFKDSQSFDSFFNITYNDTSANLCTRVTLFTKEQLTTVMNLVNNLQKLNFVGRITNVDKATARQLYPSFLKNYQPHVTTGDGNCLFNMVSLSLIGDESLMVTLRKLTLFFILYMRSSFERLFCEELKLLGEKKLRNSLECKKDVYISNKLKATIQRAKTNESWGNQYHLLALSTFLNKNICIYSQFPIEKNGQLKYQNDISDIDLSVKFHGDKCLIGHHLLYEPMKDENIFNSDKLGKSIYGFFYNNNHYVSLIPIDEHSVIFLPNSKLFKFANYEW